MNLTAGILIAATTWFGAIDLIAPDGQVTHDTAVLVLEQHGPVVTGSVGRSIDEQTPFASGGARGRVMRFHVDVAGGLDFSLRRNGTAVTGSAVGPRMHAQLRMHAAPELVPRQQLIAEITEADRELFEAFQTCDVQKYGRMLSRDVEFYHDRTGRTGYDENLGALRNRCHGGIQLRRELDAASLVIDAVPGFGAIEAGTHRFYARQPDGSERLDATARFTNVWTKASGRWRVIRIVSYDHH